MTGIVRCLRCHRRLTAAGSVARLYGRTCARRNREAAAELGRDFSAELVEDAVELVELGGVVPLRRGVFLTVGSHGATYRTTATGQCDCLAGLHGRVCHHWLAVYLLAA